MHSLTLAAALLLCTGALAGAARAQIVIDAELGDDSGLTASELAPQVEFDPEVPTPESVLGYEVGSWHVRPEQMLPFFERLAATSDRVVLEIQGVTHERRPQPLLIITSPDNHQRLEQIREAHLEIALGNREPSADDPVVVLLGFSIHGNEPSGANASLLVAYHLAAARGGEVDDWLQRAVVLIDPSFNPDGLARFASWVNSNRGATPNPDPTTREHVEPWPRGRTNHYLFDLNRDWLLAQQPESRNRLRTFHRWRPNLVTDHHEMGSNATFFFQPGVPERTNPLIPQNNVDLTHRLAEFHADALDAAGRLYYSEEGFDDFYPGKGSTYPDLQGSVGILFEQAGADGHELETENGVLTFAFGVANQYYAALSSVRGAVALRQEFLEHQSEFARQARQAAAEADDIGYVIGVDGDRGRLRHLLDYFEQHRIEARLLAEAYAPREGEEVFAAEASLWVPLEQPQSVLVRSLFEPLLEFEDDIFYDVSTWSLPLAFGARVHDVQRGATRPRVVETDAGISTAPLVPRSEDSPPTLAYVFRWNEYYAPRALGQVLAAGARARMANEPFELLTDHGPQQFDRGSVVVPSALAGDVDLEELFGRLARENGLEIFRVLRGLAKSGVDLGSPSLEPVELPSVAVLAGGSTRSYGTGEVWHLLDYRFRLPTTLLDPRRLGAGTLAERTHLVLPDGSYRFGEDDLEDLRAWVREGGVVIGLQGGAHWLAEQFGAAEESTETPASSASAEQQPTVFADYRRDRAAELIGGTIVGATFDLTHPLAYGYRRELIPLFRTNERLLPDRSNPYEVVARYTDPPRLSGYISPTNQERLAGTPAVVAYRYGRGAVIQFADNLNFRSFWFGTSKLFLNGIFAADLIAPTSAPDTWHREDE